MVVASKLVFDNPVFSMFAFHSSVLVAKMLLVTLRTSLARIASKCFSNDEDIQAFTDGNNTKAVGHGSGDEFVERCRRAHLNDLENILPFLAVGLLYVLTNPTPKAAGCHFRIFTAVSEMMAFFSLIILCLPEVELTIVHFVRGLNCTK
ncbi:expressed hypothetical protein [Trichoplax adhaerens]|uniref:Microsomal glutathione S-transferase 1 n=1 Tax=Trichoplax adhaerens TaxID=10228 RepID=B3RNC7_TRIAD|nr:expressed hypothetical protein [Trichoplax adhaerens]EDV27430.1 expressed hypothetical protein [Trichoplax adhaerens]|eukprot:XP_002109264.1 expressed hypothetical protein [Trichoplax adhaerens]